MPLTITRSSPVIQSPRVQQVLGLFDVPPTATSELTWTIDLLDRLPTAWHIGVIVGPSGCGKSTVARECFNDFIPTPFTWPTDRSVIDAFPQSLGIRDITGLLASVGFSSPPAWLRPFHILSTGQQFRVMLARTLAEAMIDGKPKLVDEYTSVVDRTVARIGSAAIAKTIRRHGLKFIAVTCHYDVIDWLSPDWIYEPHTNHFEHITDAKHTDKPTDSSVGKRVVQPPSPNREDLPASQSKRPAIKLEIIRTNSSAWHLFKPHHYLTAHLHRSAACYAALVDGQPAAFTAVLAFPHPTVPGWREHRTVCLPDFQGVGIGNAISEFIAAMYAATGKPYTSTTSHPAMIAHRKRSPLWRMTRPPSLLAGHRGKGFSAMRKAGATTRLTAGFRYIGPPRLEDAIKFGLRVERQ